MEVDQIQRLADALHTVFGGRARLYLAYETAVARCTAHRVTGSGVSVASVRPSR